MVEFCRPDHKCDQALMVYTVLVQYINFESAYTKLYTSLDHVILDKTKPQYLAMTNSSRTILEPIARPT